MHPYHPALPTTEQAKAHYNEVTSDHVSFLATIPVKKHKKIKELKIVSWNVLESDAFNGFSPLSQSVYGESDLQRSERHDRIALSLAKMVHENNPDFITLQEITANPNPDRNIDNDLYRKIIEKLGAHYDSCYSYDIYNEKSKINDMGGCITLYNTQKFRYDSSDRNRFENAGYRHDFPLGGVGDGFRLLDDKQFYVKILSAHASFNAHPGMHEHHIERFLDYDDLYDEKWEPSVSIVIGDFNCSIAPLHSNPQNITTSVAITNMREEDTAGKIQGAFSIDGCFFATAKTSTIPHQAKTEQLNPVTGKRFTAQELPPIDITSLSPLQRKEVRAFRMAISLDYEVMKKKFKSYFQSYHNLADLMDYRWTFSEYKPLLRLAMNLNNETGIGLVIPKPIYQIIHEIENPFFQLKQEMNNLEGKPYYIVYAPLSDIKRLYQLMKDTTNLYELDTKINQLQDKGQLNETCINHFQCLYQRLQSDLIHQVNQSSHSSITEHFIAEAMSLLQNPKPTVEAIKKSAQKLDHALYGKPPISKSTKTIICGLIGGLIGAAAGLIIGTTLSSWGGGFAALPAALMGLNMGTALVVGTSAAGSLIGGSAGFFSGKSKQLAYEQTIKHNKEKARARTAAIDAVFSDLQQLDALPSLQN